MRRTIGRLLIFAVLGAALFGLLSGGNANAELCKIEKGPNVCLDVDGGILVQLSGKNALVSVGALYADGAATGVSAIGGKGNEFALILLCFEDQLVLYTNDGDPAGQGAPTPLGVPCPAA